VGKARPAGLSGDVRYGGGRLSAVGECASLALAPENVWEG